MIYKLEGTKLAVFLGSQYCTEKNQYMILCEIVAKGQRKREEKEEEKEEEDQDQEHLEEEGR